MIRNESQLYFEALSHTNILAITDAQGKIIFANDKFVEISKFPRDQIIGRTHNIINSGHHPASFWKNLWKTIGSGQTWYGRIKNKAKDGSFYWVDTTIVPFLDKDGKPIKYVAIRKDITHEVRLEEERDAERARAIFAEKMASLGEMASGIGHELGNPLAAISGRLEMLADEFASPEFDKDQAFNWIQSCLELTSKMQKIIKSMRAYARETSGDPLHEVDLVNTLQSVLDFSKEKLRHLNIDVKFEHPDGKVLVCCRESELSQVIVNLVANSCYVIEKNKLQARWIRLVLEGSADRVTLKLIDSGAGIPEEIQKKMWQPFFSSKPVGEGTGLGLHISRKIVESHNGKFFLDPKSPNTCFVIELPRNQPC